MEFPVGLITSATTVFLFYPYRDFVKFYPTAVDGSFIASRYRGLASNPQQLALLALPNAFMLSLGGGGDMASLAAASTASGFTRRFLRTLIVRMGERTGSRAGSHLYSSNFDCLTKVTASRGPMSWFVGGTAAALVQFVTSGLAIRSVGGTQRGRRHYGRNNDVTTTFFYDWWYTFRAHAFFTTLSAPLRNALSSAMHVQTRGGDYLGAATWARSELSIYRESALVSRRMFQDMGIRYFFQGTIRSVLKVSLPFGFNLALYKLVCGGYVTSRRQ